ncbi:MAG: bifunctional folylpolyglutamate synthase/dihydrofolate synthase [Candidatus Aminicenantia bacterium]
MSINEAISFLDFLGKFRIKLSLERIEKLSEKFGNPHTNFLSIHIAGTNGKGSVCTFLSEILCEAGYKVGLYTSPHILDIRERIKVNGEMIKEGEFASIIEEIKYALKETTEEDFPTYFETLTMLAFIHFKRENIDFGIIETGLGGRFDATNIIFPVLSGITNISYDHTDYLGKTIENIAFEKSGIIKNGVPICFGGKSVYAWKVIKKVAEDKKTVAYWLHSKMFELKRIRSKEKMGFYFKSLRDEYEIFPALKGMYQGENIGLSILLAELLQDKGFNINKENILRGIENSFIEGRFEFIEGNPKIILDGAHNADAMKNLINSLEELGIKSFVLLYASMKDKEIEKISRIIFPFAKKIVLTKAEEIRGEEPENIAERSKFKGDFIIEKKVEKAFNIAKLLCSSEDTLLITGSLYLVGAVKKILKSHKVINE